MVAVLERRGYIERVADPADGRARLVVLTQAGKDLVRAAVDIIDGIEREWIDRWDAHGLSGDLGLRSAALWTICRLSRASPGDDRRPCVRCALDWARSPTTPGTNTPERRSADSPRSKSEAVEGTVPNARTERRARCAGGRSERHFIAHAACLAAWCADRRESEFAVVHTVRAIAGKIDGVSDLTGCEAVAVHAEGPERSRGGRRGR